MVEPVWGAVVDVGCGPGSGVDMLARAGLPAFGIDGPYSGAAGYGSIIEAMGGIGYRQGYEREGARISNIYYPDPVAGVHAAVGLLAGLHRRDMTGRGLELDLSHQEATWSLHGDALVVADRDGRDVARMGNREPGCPVAAGSCSRASASRVE